MLRPVNDQPAGSLNDVFAYPPTAAGPRKKGANVDSDAQELAKLITVPDEFEASVIVSRLEADGIRGGLTVAMSPTSEKEFRQASPWSWLNPTWCARHRLSTSYAATAVRSTGRTSTSTTE